MSDGWDWLTGGQGSGVATTDLPAQTTDLPQATADLVPAGSGQTPTDKPREPGQTGLSDPWSWLTSTQPKGAAQDISDVATAAGHFLKRAGERTLSGLQSFAAEIPGTLEAIQGAAEAMQGGDFAEHATPFYTGPGEAGKLAESMRPEPLPAPTDKAQEAGDFVGGVVPWVVGGFLAPEALIPLAASTTLGENYAELTKHGVPPDKAFAISGMHAANDAALFAIMPSWAELKLGSETMKGAKKAIAEAMTEPAKAGLTGAAFAANDILHRAIEKNTTDADVELLTGAKGSVGKGILLHALTAILGKGIQAATTKRGGVDLTGGGESFGKQQRTAEVGAPLERIPGAEGGVPSAAAAGEAGPADVAPAEAEVATGGQVGASAEALSVGAASGEVPIPGSGSADRADMPAPDHAVRDQANGADGEQSLSAVAQPEPPQRSAEPQPDRAEPPSNAEPPKPAEGSGAPVSNNEDAPRQEAVRIAESGTLEEKLANPLIQDHLRAVAADAGWAQKGGEIIRDQNGKVTGRTRWAANAEWWADRPLKINADATKALIEKAVNGDKLGEKQREMVEYMLNQTPHSGSPLEPPPEPRVEDQNTSIKFRIMDRELEAMGLDPAAREAKHEWEQLNAAAEEKVANDPAYPSKLIDAILNKGRLPTAAEKFVLMRERNRLRVERQMLHDEGIAAYQAGDPETAQALEKRIVENRDQFARASDAAGVGASRSGQSLAASRAEMKEDYSLANIEREYKLANKGQPLNAEQEAKIVELHDKLAKAQADLETLTKRNADLEQEKAIKESIRGMKRERRQSRVLEARKAMDESLQEIIALSSRARAGPLDVDLLAAVVKHAKNALDVGYSEFAKWAGEITEKVGDHIKPYLEEAWAKAREIRLSELAAPIKDKLAEGREFKTLGRDVSKIAEDFVAHGVEDRTTLVDSVHEVLTKAGLKPSKREVADAISGYGQFKPLTKDATAAKLRDLKGQLQQVAKLDDMEQKLAPLKTGVERRAPSDEERRLIQQVNEAKKKLGISSTDPETELKSALESTKKRLTNQISDLQAQIDAKQKAVKERVPGPSDKETEALKKRRDELKAKFDEIFAEPKTYTPESVKQEKALQRQIDTLATRIAAGDTSAKGAKAGPDTARVAELKVQRAALQKELADFRESRKPEPLSSEEIAVKNYKARKLAEIEDLQAKLDAGDYSKPEPRVARELSPEELKLRAQVDAAKREIVVNRMRVARENETVIQKSIRYGREIANLPTAVMASTDLSATFRQGGFHALAHPIEGLAKPFAHQIQAAFSEARSHEIDTALRNHPLYDEARRSGVEFTAHDTSFSHREEQFRSEWAEKIPLVAASERAFRTFLNVQRMNVYAALRGARPDFTPKELKTIAEFVNVGSGRGEAGRFGSLLSGLGAPLWAPRLLLSRFQLLTGYPMWRGTAATRGLIAMQYAKTLGALAAIYGVSRMMGAQVEDDPRSSDFGKIRFGNVRVDPLMGLAQVTTFLGREGALQVPFTGIGFASGVKSVKTGQVSSLRNPKYGQPDAVDVIKNFVRTKLRPSIGMPLDLIVGKDVTGQPVTPASAAAGAITPLVLQDTYKAMLDQGIAKGTALGMIAALGFGVQVFDANKPKAPHETVEAPR